VAQASTVLAREAQGWQVTININGLTTANVLLVMGVDAAVDRAVRQYDLAEGRWLAERGDPYEAVITTGYAADKGLRLGDDLVIVTPGGSERLEIVGLIERSGAGLLNDGNLAVAPLAVVRTCSTAAKALTRWTCWWSRPSPTRRRPCRRCGRGWPSAWARGTRWPTRPRAASW
jgi:hypothetical protein